MTVQALTGLMSRLGEPGQPPIYLGMGSGDAYGGLLAALGILVALQQRRQTGKGQIVDASLYGAQLLMAAPTLQAYLATGDARHARQRSRRAPDNPLWNTYPAGDRWLFVCVPNDDAHFARLRRALGDPPLSRDARFTSAQSRREHAGALVDALDALFRTRTAADWTARLGAEQLAASPIGTLRDVSEDPQAWANDYLLETYCEEVKRQVNIRGLPVGLSKTPGRVESLGPELGQDSELLLADLLGYSWDEIDALKAGKVIP
jgi:crotonobetainyl-CoA:carnitine CoA-transferase CaiB-like acyl-CoA transferase